MRYMRYFIVVASIFMVGPVFPRAAVLVEQALVIERKIVNVTGTPVEKVTVNGTIPGPTLHFTEGDTAVIEVTNFLDEVSSVHWHGLLLPGEMDGVPGFNGFAGIAPGQTFTYRFPVRQSGTYWYHAHSRGQEQDGHYGAIIIHPQSGETVAADKDYVVLLSDFHDKSAAAIQTDLKKNPEFYQNNRRTLGDFFADIQQQGFGTAWQNARTWGEMRMLPTDLADVSGYTFLVNGRTPQQNWTALFTPGERVRLRFINASAMSFYDVRIPGLTMVVVAADGQLVEPVPVDEFRIGAAETYDVIVTPQSARARSIVAESIDRTGVALATLAPRGGMRGPAPALRPRALLTLADMGHGTHSDPGNTMHPGAPGAMADHAGHDAVPPADDRYATGVTGSGWAQHGSPEGNRVLSYRDLRYAGEQQDTRPVEREIEVRLGGNMERYTWTMNDEKYGTSSPIELEYGERVRLTFINETMMAHPMHLHGMFVQLDNGQSAQKLPNKHTIVIAPGDRYSALLTADAPGTWAFHCHLLYHMMSGMMNEVVVAQLTEPGTNTAARGQ